MRRLRGPCMTQILPAAATPLIEVRDLTVRLHGADRPILSDVDFTILPGEIVTVVGPNGSGKSTLLALIAGTLTPWSGSVRVAVPFALFDQRVALLDPLLSIADNFLRRNPGVGNNACRAAPRSHASAFAPTPPTASSARSAAGRCSAPGLPACSARRSRRKC